MTACHLKQAEGVKRTDVGREPIGAGTLLRVGAIERSTVDKNIPFTKYFLEA